MINFNNIVCKYGDNGLAYTKSDLIKYEKEYAKRAGMEYFMIYSQTNQRTIFNFFLKITKILNIIQS